MMKKSINPRRTKCAVYARVVRYLHPIDQWNEGKRAEYEGCVELKVK